MSKRPTVLPKFFFGTQSCYNFVAKMLQNQSNALIFLLFVFLICSHSKQFSKREFSDISNQRQLRQSSSRKHRQLFNGFDDDIASHDSFQNQSDNENITKQAINEKAYTISSSFTEKRCSNAQRQSQAINVSSEQFQFQA